MPPRRGGGRASPKAVDAALRLTFLEIAARYDRLADWAEKHRRAARQKGTGGPDALFFGAGHAKRGA